MNTRELRSRISVRWAGYGTQEITIVFRGKEYKSFTHNTLATDRITGYADEVSDRTVKDFYTAKGALMALWRECKKANNLDS